jgi:hypothetical protein
MPDFKHFQVKKLSEQAMSKLRRGLPARLMEGTGTQLCVLPHQFDAISKSFLKKKGINVTLSPPEVAENATIDGGSIFGRRIDKALEKKQGLKNFLYTAGTALKPIAQAGLEAGAAYATSMGVPSSVTDLVKDTATQYMNDPSSLQNKEGQMKLLKQVGKAGLDAASPYLSQYGVDVGEIQAAGKALQDKKRAVRSARNSYQGYDMRAPRSPYYQGYDMRQQAPRYSGYDMRQQAPRYSDYGMRAPSSARSSNSDYAAFEKFMNSRDAKKAAPPASTNPYSFLDTDGIVGNGLYAGGQGLGYGLPHRAWDSSKRFVHQGTSLIGGLGIQALESQNLDQNWQHRYTLPPAFQRR